MAHRRRIPKRSTKLLAGIIIIISLWRLLFIFDFTPKTPQQFGVSFAQSQAEYLGFDWRELYQKMLDELDIKYIRIGAYWNRIENKPGEYDFSELDWMLDEARQRNVKVMLVVGRRLPRWPECHTPAWAANESNELQQKLVEKLVAQVVKRYKTHPAIEYWQVENEPFLKIFGLCPKTPRSFVQDEMATIRSYDPSHPTLTTDSGELATWFRTAHLGDYFGTTTYRVVYHPWFGYIKHNLTIPAAFYRIKSRLVNIPSSKVIVTELQAEPWAPGDLLATPVSEQFESMDIEQFRHNIQFAQKMGFPRVYLWGVEWWYWMEAQGFTDYKEQAKLLFDR